MTQNVFIIGASGKVGRALIHQIFEKGDMSSDRHRNPTRIVGVASSKWYVTNPRGDGSLSKPMVDGFLECQFFGQRYWSLLALIRAASQLARCGVEHITFIDVTAAGKSMLDFHMEVIRNTQFGLVTANKLPLFLADFSTFCELTAQVNRYGFRCSVMAGAEAVNKVRDLKDLGDEPIEISGCFSGTLGYITSELEKGRKFSEIVREAKDFGYTEPNPAEDLSGDDVARKILILARTAGCDIDPLFFSCHTLIPPQYLQEKDPEIFLSRLSELDASFFQRAEIAKKRGSVLRYVASFQRPQGSYEKPCIRVGLEEVPSGSPLGALTGTSNKVIIRTTTYNGNPYCVEAPGAGLDITAQNIRRDLLDQISQRVVSY